MQALFTLSVVSRLACNGRSERYTHIGNCMPSFDQLGCYILIREKVAA